MIASRVLAIAMMVSANIIFGMNNTEKGYFRYYYGKDQEKQLKKIIEEKDSYFEKIVPEIRALAQNNFNWKTIVNSAYYTENLLHDINFNLGYRWQHREGNESFIRSENHYVHLEIGAALLGTPGAIAFGKEYIKQDAARERLQKFLLEIVRLKEGGNHNFCLAWPDEDRDVVKAGLDMGLNSYMLCGPSKLSLCLNAVAFNKAKVVELLLNAGFDKDFKLKYTDRHCECHYTALHEAVMSGCNEVIDLLIERKANLNAIDECGKTPLIVATQHGRVEIVKKLIAAGAVVWLLDGYDKTALDWAKFYLSGFFHEDFKKKLSKIIPLLEDALKGEKKS